MSTAPLRQELEDLIRRDLLGAVGREREIITEPSAVVCVDAAEMSRVIVDPEGRARLVLSRR